LRVFTQILFAIYLLSFTLITCAGNKVGYVQMKVIMQSQQSLDVGKKLMAEFKPRNAELEKFAKQVQDKQTTFEKDAPNLSQKDYAIKLKEVEYLKIDLDRKRNRQHEDFVIRKQEELNNFENSINAAVTTLGQNEGYDLILFNTGGYIGPKVDVTDKVLKLIK
jgi:outer membrane protein